MKEDPAKHRELRSILDTIRDSQATAEQLKRLETLVAEDRECRQSVVRQLHLQAGLHWAAALAQADGPAAGPPQGSAEDAPTAPRAASPLLGFLGDVAKGIHWHTHPIRFFTVAALLTLVMWCGFYLATRPALRGPGEVAERPGETPLPFVAKLRQAVDAQWGGDQAWAPVVGAHLRQGQFLELKSGLAEICFDSGANVVLEGPAEFTLDDENACMLHLGRLAANVPERAHGFAVRTPCAEIVDKGTRFGTEVDDGGETFLVVFEGKVDLEIQSPGQTHRRKQRVTAGEGVRITGDVARGFEITRAAPDSVAFTASMPKRSETSPALAGNIDAAAYERWARLRAELVSEPVANMPMEGEPPSRSGAIESAIDRFGRPDGAWRFATKGPAGPFASVALGPSNQLMPSSDQPVTIVAWVHPEHLLPVASENRIVTLFKGPGATAVSLAMGSGSADRGYLGIGFHNRRAFVGTHGDRQVEAGRWYHVALTYDGRTLRTYLNGEPDQTVATQLAPCSATRATVGAFSPQKHGFVGSIDDVVILGRAASAEEVSALYQAGRPSSPDQSSSPNVSTSQENEP